MLNHCKCNDLRLATYCRQWVLIGQCCPQSGPNKRPLAAGGIPMACIQKRQTKQGIRYRVRISLKGHPRISETFTTTP